MSFETTVERKAEPESCDYDDDADYVPPEDFEVESNGDTIVSYEIDCHVSLSPIDSSGETIRRSSLQLV